MGLINSCTNRDKPLSTFNDTFSKRELSLLERLFSKLSTSTGLSESSFVQYFEENHAFGKKLYDFMQYISQSQYVMIGDYLKAIELLVKSQEARSDKPFRYFDIVEVIGLISMRKFGDTDLDQKTTISYNEAGDFICDLLSFINFNNQENNRIVAKAFLDGVFQNKSNLNVDWTNFFNHVKSHLKYLAHFLRYYFSFKFYTNSLYFVTPTINPPSKIFTQQHNFDLQFLSLLFLSNVFAAITDQFNLVFSTSLSGFNFRALVKSLIDFPGPTFIVLRHENKSNINDFSIFGGFKLSGWAIDEENYQGDEESYVFSLFPKFRNFFSLNDEKSMPCFNYLNYSQDGRKNGIGFGGNMKQNSFRIWIDQDIANKSYALSEDISYEDGSLVEGGIEKLNISCLEVFGLSKPYNSDISTEEILSKIELKLAKDLDTKMTTYYTNSLGALNLTSSNSNTKMNSSSLRQENVKRSAPPSGLNFEKSDIQIRLAESSITRNEKENNDRSTLRNSKFGKNSKLQSSNYVKRKQFETTELYNRNDQLRFSDLSRQLFGKTKSVSENKVSTSGKRKNKGQINYNMMQEENQEDNLNEQLNNSIQNQMRKSYGIVVKSPEKKQKLFDENEKIITDSGLLRESKVSFKNASSHHSQQNSFSNQDFNKNNDIMERSNEFNNSRNMLNPNLNKSNNDFNNKNNEFMKRSNEFNNNNRNISNPEFNKNNIDFNKNNEFNKNNIKNIDVQNKNNNLFNRNDLNKFEINETNQLPQFGGKLKSGGRFVMEEEDLPKTENVKRSHFKETNDINDKNNERPSKKPDNEEYLRKTYSHYGQYQNKNINEKNKPTIHFLEDDNTKNRFTYQIPNKGYKFEQDDERYSVASEKNNANQLFPSSISPTILAGNRKGKKNGRGLI